MMNYFMKIGAVTLPAAILALVIVGCQPQNMPPPAEAMPAADVEKLFVGNTIFGSAIVGYATKQKVIYAEYFSPTGESTHRVKVLDVNPNTRAKERNGKYYVNDKGEFCTYYVSLELDQKEFCKFFVSLGGGRYKSQFGVIEKILEGNRLSELE